MIKAEEAKFYKDIATGIPLLKKKFAEYLRQAGIGDMVLTLARKGEHYATFPIPSQYDGVAEEYLKELGYEVTMYKQGNVREGYFLAAQIRW